MQKLSLDVVNAIVTWKNQNIISDARFHQLLNIIHSDPIFQEVENEPGAKQPLLISPVKLKPKELYQNMGIDELLKEKDKLECLSELSYSHQRKEQFAILIDAVRIQLRLQANIMLEQIQFDYQDSTAIC